MLTSEERSREEAHFFKETEHLAHNHSLALVVLLSSACIEVISQKPNECELKADKSGPVDSGNSKTTQAIGILFLIHTEGDFYDMNWSLHHTGNSNGGFFSEVPDSGRASVRRGLLSGRAYVRKLMSGGLMFVSQWNRPKVTTDEYTNGMVWYWWLMSLNLVEMIMISDNVSSSSSWLSYQ